MIMEKEILNNFALRKAEFAGQTDIILIGHSLFDYWRNQKNYPHLFNGKTFNNWGYAGITTRQYLDIIIKSGIIRRLGKDVFIFLGVNDIVKEPQYSDEKFIEWLNEIIVRLKAVSPDSRYFVLEATPVYDFASVSNEQIIAQNDYLKAHLPQDCRLIRTRESFIENSGKLDRTLTTDGLHFNQAGYKRLHDLLTEYL